MTRASVQAAVAALGWRYILGTLRATLAVTSLPEAAAAAAICAPLDEAGLLALDQVLDGPAVLRHLVVEPTGGGVVVARVPVHPLKVLCFRPPRDGLDERPPDPAPAHVAGREQVLQVTHVAGAGARAVITVAGLEDADRAACEAGVVGEDRGPGAVAAARFGSSPSGAIAASLLRTNVSGDGG
jgi:hypothetical protein